MILALGRGACTALAPEVRSGTRLGRHGLSPAQKPCPKRGPAGEAKAQGEGIPLSNDMGGHPQSPPLADIVRMLVVSRPGSNPRARGKLAPEP